MTIAEPDATPLPKTGCRPVETPWRGYYATDDGRVWSTSGWRGKPWRQITAVPNSRGYLKVRLSLPGGRKNVPVHVVIARTFHGERPSPDHEVRHVDGDPFHNAASNLAWGTDQENSDDRVLHGRSPRGEANCHAVLTANDVVALRRMVAEGSTHRAAAERFGVARSTVSDIVYRRTWRHTDEDVRTSFRGDVKEGGRE